MISGCADARRIGVEYTYQHTPPSLLADIRCPVFINLSLLQPSDTRMSLVNLSVRKPWLMVAQGLWNTISRLSGLDLSKIHI